MLYRGGSLTGFKSWIWTDNRCTDTLTDAQTHYMQWGTGEMSAHRVQYNIDISIYNNYNIKVETCTTETWPGLYTTTHPKCVCSLCTFYIIRAISSSLLRFGLWHEFLVLWVLVPFNFLQFFSVRSKLIHFCYLNVISILHSIFSLSLFKAAI